MHERSDSCIIEGDEDWSKVRNLVLVQNSQSWDPFDRPPWKITMPKDLKICEKPFCNYQFGIIKKKMHMSYRPWMSFRFRLMKF